MPFLINEKLVRGLDYYSHTVFEFTTQALGAQGTVIAGGRYDGLIKSMGGPATAGFGWASGVDRLSLLLENQNILPEISPRAIALIAAEPIAEAEIFKLAAELRAQSWRVEIPLSGNVGKKFKRADKAGAELAIVVGSSELETKSLTVKNLKTGEQKTIPRSSLTSELT